MGPAAGRAHRLSQEVTTVADLGYSGAMNAVADRSRPGLWALAGLLAAVCTVLSLLALEHGPTQTAVSAGRDAVSRAWVRLAERRAAPVRETSPPVTRAQPAPAERPRFAWLDLRPAEAALPEDRLLTGRFAAADEATRKTLPEATFDGSDIRLADITLRTEPLEIASGRDRFGPGQTYARRLRAPDDAQIELRRVLPDQPAAGLCGGRAPHVVALLHRSDQLDLLLFWRPGPDDRTPSDVLCGAWRLEAR